MFTVFVFSTQRARRRPLRVNSVHSVSSVSFAFLQCKYDHFFSEYQNLSGTKFKLCSVVQLTFQKSLAVYLIHRIFAMWFRSKDHKPPNPQRGQPSGTYPPHEADTKGSRRVAEESGVEKCAQTQITQREPPIPQRGQPSGLIWEKYPLISN